MTLSGTTENPFDGIPICKGPGDVFRPGFFIGEGQYKFRISFPEAATARETVGRCPTDTTGPIIIREDNPQPFYYANGDPCFVLAFDGLVIRFGS